MAKISVVLPVDVASHGDLGRPANVRAAGVSYLAEFEGHPAARRRQDPA